VQRPEAAKKKRKKKEVTGYERKEVTGYVGSGRI